MENSPRRRPREVAGGVRSPIIDVMHSRVDRFRELHQSGCFVIPNPWDAGSAHLLVQLGFQALATSSAGLAWTLGRADNGVTLEQALAHFRSVTAAVDVPVSADFEGGFAIAPDDVARNVSAAAATGLAGLSIEDCTGDADQPLFDFSLAVERIAAARAAIDQSGTGLLLTGRTEGFRFRHPDLDETIRRLRAYADAGADCLFAPGLRELDHIAAVVQAVAPKPVNALVGTNFTTVAELAAVGVRRISVGGGLARVALSGFLAAADEIAHHGTFNVLSEARSFAEIDRAFQKPVR